MPAFQSISPCAPPAPTPPRERILDAAEALFADGGLQALSLRTVTRHAQVNLAAVNYHFGNKEGLVIAMVRRRFEPINARRLELLENAVTQARPGTPALTEVIDAFLEPVLSLDETLGIERAETVWRFMGRVMFLPPDMAETIYRRDFNHVSERFHAVLQETLPEIPAEELRFRMHLALGPLARVLVNRGGWLGADPTKAKPASRDILRERVCAFIAAGLSTPPVATNDTAELLTG